MTADIPLDPELFRAYLSTLIEAGASDEELDEVDNLLHHQLDQGDTQRVVDCAKISIELFSASSRPWPKAYALNTLILASFECGDFAQSRMALAELVSHSIDNETPQAGLSGIDNVRARMDRFGSPDYLMHLLAEMTRFYVHFDAIDLAVSAILEVAQLLADFGAFQPAYHALADAEGLAREHRNTKLLAWVMETEAAVAFLEGDDAFGVKAATIARDLYRKMNLAVPLSITLNLATSSMRSGDHDKALAAYEECLNSNAEETPCLPLRINMSACLRKLGDLARADEQMRQARICAGQQEGNDPEQLVELELVAAANAIAGARPTEAAKCLRDAAMFLNHTLSTVDKLHYRRAMRERYIDRIESLMCKLPAQGSASDLIDIVASTRCNQLTDWLHLLDWANELSSRLTDQEREALDQSIFRLANFGAPYLQGYLEKYNDPFAQGLIPNPWREFSELANQLSQRYGFRHALATACLENAANLIKHRLGEGYALLVILLTAKGKALLLVGERYHFCDLPIGQTAAFYESLHGHRQNTTSMPSFVKVLNEYQEALLSSFESVLPLLASDQCRGLVLFPDRLDLLPANLLVCGHAPLQARMANGEFEVRTCVAIYPRKTCNTPLNKPLALLEEPTNLQLARAQFESFCSVLGLAGQSIVNATSSQLKEAMEAKDTLILAQHGVSIGIFADPAFANTRGVHADTAMYFDTIQQSAYRWPHRLVMLSACHSGGLISRNAQRDFDSHELAGYPSILLTNRQSVVTGAAWATLDRFDYLLSTRFAIELGKGTELSRAFSIALGALITMPGADAMQLFEHIADPELKNKMNLGDANSVERIAALKQQPFCYGAYQLYTLL